MKLFEILQERRGRVLFVSLGDSLRGRMAESYANAHGYDVIEAASTSTLPFDFNSFDLIVNLGESGAPATGPMVLELSLPEPLEVRERIEAFVRFLTDHFRVAKEWSAANPLNSADPLYSKRCAVAMSSR